MKVSLLKSDGKLSEVEIEGIFDVSVSDYALAVVNRVHGQNAKQGTKKVKTRSEVRGKAAKPYRQKGTGKARQGSTKAPHFRGGGVAHGPTPDYHRLRLNRKFKRSVLKGILSKYISGNSFAFIDLSNDVRNLRKELSKEKSLVIYSLANRENTKVFRNLENVDLLPASSLSPSLILNYRKIYLDIDEKERLVDILQ